MHPPISFWSGALCAAAIRLGRPVRLMEVCGSHSFAAAKFGLRALLPESVRLLSGPGCPVCVSGPGFIDRAIALCRRNVRVAVFGDLLRIPGSEGTLQGEAGLMVIYSPEEALDYAVAHPDKEVVLAAVGFEPTLGAGAAILELAAERNAANFSLLCDFKRIRPVLDLLAADAGTRPDGFLLPGHVGSVVGEAGFAGLALPGVISGFSAENMLYSILLLLQSVEQGGPAVVNNYPEAVAASGNRAALDLIDRCFEPGPSEWRGMGNVPGGGWLIRPEFARFDAAKRFELPLSAAREPEGCRCGEVLRGALSPDGCPLFGRGCTPARPVGACMVSGEGACAAAYRYREVVA